MTEPTKQNHYLSGYNKRAVQHHEWRTADNMAEHLLPILREKAVSNPTLALLDVGAGPGTITAGLAKCIPSGSVVACDISGEILASAAAHCSSQGLSNVSTQEGSVYALPFADNSFDVVHASMILTHLDAPAAAMAELRRVAKEPGGVVAVREANVHTWTYFPEPERGGLAKVCRLLCELHAATGARVDSGARLVKWAIEAGVPREKIVAGAAATCYSSPEERAMWGDVMAGWCDRGSKRRAKAVEMGLFGEEEFDAMIEDVREWAAAEDGWFGVVDGTVVITL